MTDRKLRIYHRVMVTVALLSFAGYPTYPLHQNPWVIAIVSGVGIYIAGFFSLIVEKEKMTRQFRREQEFRKLWTGPAAEMAKWN